MRYIIHINPGEIYNNLEVLSFSHKTKKAKFWNAKCFCGNIFIDTTYNIVKTRKSCGCLKTKTANYAAECSKKWKNRKDHNDLYVIWTNMKRRCLNINSEKYYRYGERGISIYEKWIKDFDNFSSYILSTIGDRPSKKHSLDRIDNNKNYEPGNLKWSTNEEQIRNSSQAKLNIKKIEEIKKSKETAKNLAEKYNVCRSTIYRVKSGRLWK